MPVDFLAGIVAPLVAALGALDALAVEAARRGLAAAAGHQTHVLPQMLMHLGPQPRVLPAPEVVIDRRPRRKMLGQVAPLAPGLDEVEDRVEQLAVGVLAWPARPAGLGEAVVDELPLGVGQITGVAHPQRTAGDGQKSTAQSAHLLGFLEFSNTL